MDTGVCCALAASSEEKTMSNSKPRHAALPGSQHTAEFDRLFREFFPVVQRFAARRLSDPADVADAIAETFLRAIEGADRYDSRRGTAKVWLLGIARNVCADVRRNPWRERAALGRLVGRALATDDDLARIESVIDATRNQAEISAAWGALNERDREILELVVLDELPAAEAAAVLGVNQAAMRMRLARAKRRLRADLQGLGPEKRVAPNLPRGADC